MAILYIVKRHWTLLVITLYNFKLLCLLFKISHKPSYEQLTKYMIMLVIYYSVIPYPINWSGSPASEIIFRLASTLTVRPVSVTNSHWNHSCSVLVSTGLVILFVKKWKVFVVQIAILLSRVASSTHLYTCTDDFFLYKQSIRVSKES